MGHGDETTQERKTQHVYMWQSRVEIKHYSVAYFDLGTAFEVLQHGTSGLGLYALGKLMNTYYVYTAHMSSAFNGSSVRMQ